MARLLILAFTLMAIGAIPLRAQAQDHAAPHSYALKSEYSYATKIFRTKLVYKLSPGTYIQESVTKDGVFYRGPADCVTIEQSLPSRALPTLSNEGGIFIPHKPGSTAKIYLYPIAPGQAVPSETLQNGPIVNTVVRSKLTDPGFPEKQKPDPVLFSLLVSVPNGH